MKPLAIVAAVVCLSSLAVPARCQAQGPSEVVLVDLTYIFNHHAGRNAAKKSLEEQLRLAQTDMEIRRQQVLDMNRQLQSLQRDSAEYADLEGRLRDTQFEMQRDFDAKKREFLKKETQMLYATLKEVQDEVAAYCRQSGARIALQFDGEPLKIGDHNQIIKDLNRPVIFWDKSLDITPIILNQINGRHQARVPGR